MRKRILLAIISSMVIGCSMTAYAQPKTMSDGTVFDAEFYANAYPDVVAVYGTDAQSLYCHYVDYGKSEGRTPVKEEMVSPINNAELISSYETWSVGGGDYAVDTYANGIKVIRSIRGSECVDKKYWILRTDYSDGLLDEDKNGIDDRDPCNNLGYTDLNYNGVIDGSPSLPDFVPETEIIKYRLCEHGVIQGTYVCDKKECVDFREMMKNAQVY